MEKSLLSRVPTNLATRGFFQHLPSAAENPSGRQPGPMQRPAQGRSAAEQKKRHPGRSGSEARTKAGSPLGTRGFRTAVVYDLPETIVNVVPQYRGFKCIVVQDKLIIVDPGTRHRSCSSGLT
jgi:hypothetical protein